MKKVTIGEYTYYYTTGALGYGYAIVRKKKINEKRDEHKTIFRTYDKNTAIIIMSRFHAGEIVTEFPDVSDEVPPQKILHFSGKHADSFYNVPTIEHLKKAATMILKEEYGDASGWEPSKPKNESGINEESEIDALPTEMLKEKVRNSWTKYKRFLRQYERDLADWQDLYNTVNEIKGADIINAFRTYESDKWEIVTPQDIEL